MIREVSRPPSLQACESGGGYGEAAKHREEVLLLEIRQGVRSEAARKILLGEGGSMYEPVDFRAPISFFSPCSGDRSVYLHFS